MNDPLHDHLRQLPDAAPSEALWARLSDARQRQLRRRRAVLAGCAAGCVVVGIAGLMTRQPLPPSASPPPLAARNAPVSAAPQTVDALRRIDRELQLAYARNAAEAELDALWSVRRDLARSHATTARPVEI